MMSHDDEDRERAVLDLTQEAVVTDAVSPDATVTDQPRADCSGVRRPSDALLQESTNTQPHRLDGRLITHLVKLIGIGQTTGLAGNRRQQRPEFQSFPRQNGLPQNVANLGFGAAVACCDLHLKRAMNLIRQVPDGDRRHDCRHRVRGTVPLVDQLFRVPWVPTSRPAILLHCDRGMKTVPRAAADSNRTWYHKPHSNGRSNRTAHCLARTSPGR